MKIKLFILGTLILLVVNSYGQSNLFVNDTLVTAENSENCMTIFSLNNQVDTVVPSDMFVTEISINDSCLSIDIGYGGGCGNVYLKLFYIFETDSTNNKLTLKPYFIDKDYCKALRYRRINFDIRKIKKKYSTPFILRIGRFEKMIK